MKYHIMRHFIMVFTFCQSTSLGIARSHTFVEIYHEIISTIIFFLSTDSFKKGCCQLQVEVCTQITG